MSNPLATYLHDHLAGAAFAVDLLKGLRDHYSGEVLGQFASHVLLEVEQDREALQRIADRAGKETPDLKQAVGWLTEKASRFKLSHDDPYGLGTFQALEALALGILGKLALWHALAVVPEIESGIGQVELERLIARAQRQHKEVEKTRLLVAEIALAGARSISKLRG
jgi:hypothetical protein